MAFTNNIMIVRHRLLTELVNCGKRRTDNRQNRPSAIRTQPPTFKTCRALLRTQRTRCMEIQIPSSTGVGYGWWNRWAHSTIRICRTCYRTCKQWKAQRQHYVCYRRSMLGLRTDQLWNHRLMPGMYRPQLPVQLSQRSRTCTCRHRQGMDRPWYLHQLRYLPQSCPYHAIVYIPVPCEESCPVKAISKDEHGIEHIDENKCIYCGKCMNACPFGAIFEISQTFDVLQRIRKGEQVVAIVAPSIWDNSAQLSNKYMVHSDKSVSPI